MKTFSASDISTLKEKYDELNAYKEALEKLAKRIMDNTPNKEGLFAFLEDGFLEWMNSRASRARYRESLLTNKCVIESAIEELSILEKPLSDVQYKKLITRLCCIYGIGPVMASAIVTLI